ncbi:hypothetical protein ANCCAN_04619 [Ancylostoma caninum]|uniref:Cysteine rich repeat-containing domain protein n=1 Tax=Ancylostoma caninum TaxID=29170 RepID=A0A368H0Q9_ANCCA|nr:hypothetical protein ANCCAN_04619 [Ancylostoma caninum]
MPQQPISIRVPMPKFATSTQCFPLCQQSCGRTCGALFTAETCSAPCKMSCQQRCAQVTTIAEKQQSTVMQAHAGTSGQCMGACSPKCSQECTQDQQLPLDQQVPVVAPASTITAQEQQLLSGEPSVGPGLAGPLPQQLSAQQAPIIPGTMAGEDAAAFAPYPEGPTFIPLNSESSLLQELLMTDPTLISGPIATGEPQLFPQPPLTSVPLPAGGAYSEEFGQPAFITGPAGLTQSPQMLAGEPALSAGVPQLQQELPGQQMPIPGQFPAGMSQPDLGLTGQPTLVASSATADADKEQLVPDQPGLSGEPQQPQQGLADQTTPTSGRFPTGSTELSQSQPGLIGQATPIPGLFPVGPSGLLQPQQNFAGEPSLISTPSLAEQQPPFLGQPSFTEGTPEDFLGAQPSLTSIPAAAGLGQPTVMIPGRPGLAAGAPELQQGPLGQPASIPGQLPAGLLQPQQGLIGEPGLMPGQFLAGGPQLSGQPTPMPGQFPSGLLQPQQGFAGQPSLISGPQQLMGSPVFPGGVSPSQSLLAGQPSLIFDPSATGLTQPSQLLGQPKIGAGAAQLPEQESLPYPLFQSTSPILVASQPQQLGNSISRKGSMVQKI